MARDKLQEELTSATRDVTNRGGFEEARIDYEAARLRDAGEDVEAYLSAERKPYIPAVLGDADAKNLIFELDQVKRDTYVESEVQVAGWNYEKGPGGFAFHELPVADREVMIEDGVDWGKYMDRGLTFEDQGRIMYHGARDVPGELDRKPGEIAPALPTDATKESQQGTLASAGEVEKEYGQSLNDAAERALSRKDGLEYRAEFSVMPRDISIQRRYESGMSETITNDPSTNSVLEHVEQQLRDIKRATVNNRDEIIGPWSELDESARLEELEGGTNWEGISHKQKQTLLAREIDFGKITRDELNTVYERIGSDDIDTRPARRLFDEANFARAVADLTPFHEQMAKVRDSTRNLIEATLSDQWPRSAAIVDFGIDSQKHYESLYYPIRNGEIGPAALDAAMGHGRHLTELVSAAKGNPHKDVQFHTAWDDMLGRAEGDHAPVDFSKPINDYERGLQETVRNGSNHTKDKGIER